MTHDQKTRGRLALTDMLNWIKDVDPVKFGGFSLATVVDNFSDDITSKFGNVIAEALAEHGEELCNEWRENFLESEIQEELEASERRQAEEQGEFHT